MPNKNWAILNSLQLGRYAEYFARMEFASYGLEVFSSEAWKVPNEVFVDRNYDKPGQTSNPEYGINISNRNYEILKSFEFEETIKGFIKYSSEGNDIL